jgi:transcriptional regulator with XRE-family HTH domain
MRSRGGGTDERASQTFKKSPRYASELQRLGANVRGLRHERGWTLEQAAERSSLDLKHLQKVEAGVLNLTMVTLVRIADGFNVPLHVLFDPSGRPGASRPAGRTKRKPGAV